ncbi:MAG TPA: M14 metallopeptidase family protein [Terriglobales bacterium]|nr:M14 metallopeptidase family protein [Terriglobales bacterium]
MTAAKGLRPGTRLAGFVSILLLAALAAGAQAPPSPEAFFGFKLGSDKKLADWSQLTAYYQKLAAVSPRIRYANLGPTTEGRPFALVTISAPENLAQLAHYQAMQDQLADPRRTPPAAADRLIAQGKMILAITCNIHSTEIASSQTAAQFAYEMATGNSPEIQQILHNVIILLVPSLNPDGQQLVVDWYKKYLGTPYEGMGPVVLYQKYVGHDDNRDWYMFTQKETRLTVEKVLNPWHPQILYDVHQMGANGPRLFLPPWVDPIDPNIDPIIVQSMNAVGMDTARDLTAQGKSGVLVDGVYDGWSPARQYIVYHDGLRLLTESASVRIASPENMPFDRLGKGIGYDAKVAKWNFPEPWPGGEWHLGDIVNYQLAAFFSIARNGAVNREQFLRNFYTVAQRAVTPGGIHAGWPYAYVIPARQADPRAAATLVNTLREGAVEVLRAGSGFTAAGQEYAAGSYIVKLAQPFGAFAKTLLENQHYPDIRQYPGGPPQRPYDVTAQTLPLLLGVKAVAVPREFDAAAALLTHDVTAAPGTVAIATGAPGYEFADQSNGSLLAAFDLLKQGKTLFRLSGGAAPGTIYIPASAAPAATLQALAAKYSVNLKPGDSSPSGALALKLPRTALYQSWVSQIDEGWTRWIFDQDGIPYARLQDAEVRAGNLNAKFDVIVIPDQAARSLVNGNPAGRVPPEYAGGLGAQGMAGLKAFVEGGGTLVALNQASLAFLDWTGGQVQNALEGDKQFYSPGSILRVTTDPSDPLAYGAAPETAIFSEQSPAFALSGQAKSAANYGGGNPLLSGWLLGGEKLAGRSALATVPLGKGRLVLFGFKPQYRAQSEATYRFLFNAMLSSASGSAGAR